MRWSIPVGRLFGIELRLHVTFLLLLAFFGYISYASGGQSAVVWTLTFVCAIFACIVLHEFGHSLVAQALGVEVRSITLLPIGGVAALRRIPENPWHEIAITLAGPMMNAIIALVILPFSEWPRHFLVQSYPHNMPELLGSLVAANITLFLFNFIPAFPMDGGRLLRAVLALVLPYQRATVIAATLGQGLAILSLLVGFWMSHIGLIIIGAFIFMAAEGEEKMVKIRHLLRDLRVEDVMTRDFATLAPTDTLGRGLELLYQTGQDDIPVMEGDRFCGMISRMDLVEAVNAQGQGASVASIMDTTVPAVSPHDRVSEVYEEMMTGGHEGFPVEQDGRIIGMLSPINISRYVLVHGALKSSRRGGWTRRAAAAPAPAPPPLTAGVRPTAAPPAPEVPPPETGRV
jgi:stage IV sporulation protein FB